MATAEVDVAIAALLVSLVALTVTFMQVLQQYYASAAGYWQCNEKVIGGWSKTRIRRFRWRELRYEVQYDAPVIFVSFPTNKNGPINDAPIYLLDGTDQSLQDTWTNIDNIDPRSEYLSRPPEDRVHTADNERASWLTLLHTVQRMERMSRKWQEEQYGSPGSLSARYGFPYTPPSLLDHHTLTVVLQRKRKSWDTMPTSMTKPYATSTICHVVEMLAALGIYWKDFDRRLDRYWAEGNGFVVLGERVADLGIVFSLQICGKCTFARNRVIPVDYIKELAFGHVPTIYRHTVDLSRLKAPADLPDDLSSLQMGSDREIAESLTAIGCSTNAVNCFLDSSQRTSHLFPMAFEILGMLSQTFHINNSSFTFIPNPTPYYLDKRSLSLVKLLEAYQVHFEKDATSRCHQVIFDTIGHHVREVLRQYSEKDGAERLVCLRALHVAIDDMDEILTAKQKAADRVGSDGVMLNPNHSPSPSCSDDQDEIRLQSQRRELVQDVLRSHIQEVLRLLNDRQDHRIDVLSLHPMDRVALTVPPSPSHAQAHFKPKDSRQVMSPRFEDVDDASPEERQRRLMDVYFEVIRGRVVSQAALSTGRRASQVFDNRGMSRGPSPAPHPGSHVASSSTRHVLDDVDPAISALILGDNDGNDDSHDKESDIELDGTSDAADKEEGKMSAEQVEHCETATDGREGERRLWEQEASHDDIWCTLVVRMICWMMLHDVNKLDVQLAKGELLSSRVPVYIA